MNAICRQELGDERKKAYCAMVYLVYLTEDGKAHVRLVASKTRVDPLKVFTIPRLELIKDSHTADEHGAYRVTVTGKGR